MSVIVVLRKFEISKKETTESLENIIKSLDICIKADNNIKRNINDANIEFNDLCEYLGENEKKTIEIIFGEISKFINSVENCATKIDEKKKRKERLAAKK